MPQAIPTWPPASRHTRVAKGFFCVLCTSLVLLLLPTVPWAAKADAPLSLRIPTQEEQARALATQKAQQARQAGRVVEDHESMADTAFASHEEVTQTCLGCHDQSAAQVHASIHWTWLDAADPEEKLGKRGLSLNNFGISLHSNEARCASCHAGNGFGKPGFDFTSEEAVNCLICHDSTGAYTSSNTKLEPQHLSQIASKVALPTRKNCGTCHFFGAGDDALSHGNLEPALDKPERDFDVHMAHEGANFSCHSCHAAGEHQLRGLNKVRAGQPAPAAEQSAAHFIRCESCHTATPHPLGHKANYHAKRMSCQSCHVPFFARTAPMQSLWDWSAAGARQDGKAFTKTNADGTIAYATTLGAMEWTQNAVPDYVWYNGTVEYISAGDRIDPKGVVRLNRLLGSKDDPQSRIMPVRIHRGVQPYDTETNTLLIAQLFGDSPDAYENSLDWDRAIRAGMLAAGLPYSGKYAFVRSEYVYPLTHMIAPGPKALHCNACHAKNGRLGDMEGFYLPGRDRFEQFDRYGLAAVLITLAGVAVHFVLRRVARMVKKPVNKQAKPETPPPAAKPKGRRHGR